MSATPLNIVILAAGKGTRMYSKMPLPPKAARWCCTATSP